jgi:HD-GYP domain-containing protein (c-di-GMP phosphodiesterase class II)
MKKDESPTVAIADLRIGMFVDLAVGWMAHPFPSGSFKISSQKQIEIIQGLGLERVRYVPEKSDGPQPDAQAPAPEQAVSATELPAAPLTERARLALQAQQLRAQRASLLSAQDRNLLACERRFGEAARQYRKTLELVEAQPQVVGGQCLAMVGGFVDEMMAEGDSAIRLLTEAAGDKSSMHSVNVTVVALLLGRAMGLGQTDMLDLGVAAFLHDIGKTKLPDRVRWFEDSFTSTEYKLYQDHVGQSVYLGKTMELSNGCLLAMAQHHEMVDGSGFPARAKGDAITAIARILSLVNRYDNLCNPSRPGAALTPHEALSLMFAQHKARFDSSTLSAFIHMMGVYPPGSVVQLVDERYASVVSVNSSRPLKPKVIVYEPGVSRRESLILDLEQSPNISIRRSLKPANLPLAAMDCLAPRQRICYFFERAIDPQMHEAVS